MDVGEIATPKGGLLAAQWFSALVMFSTMAAANSQRSDSARQYVIAIGVIAWLCTTALIAAFLLGYAHQLPTFHLDHQGPVLQITGKLTADLVYQALFAFLSLVAFFCAASHAHGSGNAAASAFFSMILTVTTLGAAFTTYKDLSEELSQGPILQPGAPSSVNTTTTIL
mmetsp:Transcript_15870/g.40465  ORF Transcript_15870/g.40465 Transcript_15870/m.40465 type:complete len:169 (+) Transcript_15870:175-681(+)